MVRAMDAGEEFNLAELRFILQWGLNAGRIECREDVMKGIGLTEPVWQMCNRKHGKGAVQPLGMFVPNPL